MCMVPWRVYQKIGSKLDIPTESMHLVNILADGGYLVANQPPYLNLEVLDDVGTRKTWLKEYPTEGIEFCKETYGSDAALAATLRAVGHEVAAFTDSDLSTGFALLADHIVDYLYEVKNPAIRAEINRVQKFFEENKMELKHLEETHFEEERSYAYCDSCGRTLPEPFPYRCEDCDARFPGWPPLVYDEGEEESSSRWRQQMDVTVLRQNRSSNFLIVRADTSLPGWIEEGSRVGAISESGLDHLGRIVNTDDKDIHIDYEHTPAAGLSVGQDITICSSESSISTTQQLGFLYETRREFNGWRSSTEDDRTVEKLASNAPRLIDALDQTEMDPPDPARPSSWKSLEGFELDDSQKKAVAEICGLERGELSLVVGPPGSGKTEVIAKAADELANSGERVLVTSHTNIAVDNVIEKLSKQDAHQVVRVGRPEKLSKGSKELMLSKSMENSNNETVSQVLERVEDLKSKISALGDGAQAGAEQQKLTELRRRIQELQQGAEAISISNADVTGATIIRSQLGGLSEVNFDTVIIDEASQISVPLGLLGMVNAKKWVIVGDHNQLRPVIKTVSTNDGSPPRGASLFSFLRSRYDIERWLKFHYRSHEDIIGFGQKHVYDDLIEIDNSCPNGTGWSSRSTASSKPEAIADGPPVVFVDVPGEEAWRKRFSGTINEAEIEAVREMVTQFIQKRAVLADELGVITPYRGQRSMIADAVPEFGELEVSTVDGFQGRERDTIIFSTVNTEKSGMRFAGNENRFNVASTRPKRRFVMVGNRSQIKAKAPMGNMLKKYIRYVERTGGIFDWQEGEWAEARKA